MKIMILIFLGLLLAGTNRIVSQAETGSRYYHQAQTGSVYVWTLKAWKDNSVLCEIFKQDDKAPTEEDIRAYCGETVYTKWASSPPCSTFLQSGDTSACEGSFLTYLGYYFRDYTTYTSLDKPSILFSLQNCNLGEWCPQSSTILFEGYETMPGQHIREIQIRVGDRMFSCLETASCTYELPLTTAQGAWLEYWVVSSYGDESGHQTFHFRNVYRGANDGQYRADILSPQTSNDFAALTWDAFPTLEHPDGKMYSQVNNSVLLKSNHHLYYLAGKLIFTGKVKASDCLDGGLLSNQMANTCGEEMAYDLTIEWQNEYNDQILSASQKYGIPAQILKAVILQESQFWQEHDLQYEYGLGCLSENGVDVLLSWDIERFLSVCTEAYDEQACSAGYASLSAKDRAYLRGMVLRAIGTDEEIDLIAAVMRANTVQVGQVMQNITKVSAVFITTYENLWDFTLANYHVGNQCVADGVTYLYNNEIPITFENYCQLSTTCPTACLFVERVKGFIH